MKKWQAVSVADDGSILGVHDEFRTLFFAASAVNDAEATRLGLALTDERARGWSYQVRRK